MCRAAVGGVGHLAREKEDALRLTDLDPLAVGGRVEHAVGAEPLDADHLKVLLSSTDRELHGLRFESTLHERGFDDSTELRRSHWGIRGRAGRGAVTAGPGETHARACAHGAVAPRV